MLQRLIVAALFVASVAGSCPLAGQEPPKEASASWSDAITVNGLAEAAYTYNFNGPDSGFNAYRVFDTHDHRVEVDFADFVVQRPVAEKGQFGFRVDLTAGTSIPNFAAAYGLFRDTTTGEAEDYDIHQAFLSYVVPMGKGLRVDLGKFCTYMGYEVLDGYDGYNDNASRSFLFGYAVPGTHTGIKASYPFTDKFTGTLMVVQGWDNVKDNNGAKSVGLQLSFAPTPKWTLALNAICGPEQTDNNRNWRYDYEIISTWKAAERLTLGVDGVYGWDDAGLGPGVRGSWSGAAAYAIFAVTDKFSLALRAECFSDSDGARTGVPQTLREATLTPSYKIGKHFVVRGDLRRDWSGADVFLHGADPSGHQATASLQVLFVF